MNQYVDVDNIFFFCRQHLYSPIYSEFLRMLKLILNSDLCRLKEVCSSAREIPSFQIVQMQQKETLLYT